MEKEKKSNLKRSRNSGGGRPKSLFDGGLSRQKFVCVVDGCGVGKRSDKLREHYLDKVVWDSEGQPANKHSLRNVAEDKRQHTQYFALHGYSKNKLPPNKTQFEIPKDPFDACRKMKQKTMKLGESSGSGGGESELSPMDHDSVEISPQSSAIEAGEKITWLEPIEPQPDSPVTENFDDAQPDSPVTENVDAIQCQSLSEESCDRIASLVAEKVLQEQRKGQVDEEETAFRSKVAQLKETDSSLICMSCVRYGHSDEVPKNLKKYAVGNFGFFKKLDCARLVNKERRENIKKHFESPLHEWCKEHDLAVANDLTEQQAKNRKACENLVTNAIFCFKYSRSAADFVRLNDKDELLSIASSATKNDGSQQFFYFRDIVHQKVAEKVKNCFKEVKSASFTLDKVTVLKTPYTVLMTYFFHQGVIHVTMNNLHVMKSDEYVGESTARLVGLDLMSSLGLTRAQVGRILHHSAYDGVYASAEERACGGGCLSLMKHFASWCQMQEEDFTGLWDMGHKLQLVFGDAMLSNAHVKALDKVVFGTMGDFLHGKGALQFKEISEELSQPTQSNKTTQETRWVRANLRAYQSFFRNLPTLYFLIGREELSWAEVGDITQQKEAQKKRVKLCDGQTIAFALGITQLLDLYSAASLHAQYLTNFPTTVMQAIRMFEKKLNVWKDGWEWEREPLRLGGVGAPAVVIAALEEGVYKPHVTENEMRYATSKRTSQLKHAQMARRDLEHDWASVEGFFEGAEIETDDDGGIKEVPVSNFDSATEAVVKQRLEGICGELLKSLETRMKTPKLFVAAFDAFGDWEEWYDSAHFSSPEQKARLAGKIRAILGEMKGTRGKKFQDNIDDLVYGYNLFLRYCSEHGSSGSSPQVSLEQLYEKFWKEFSNESEVGIFIEFFEFIQVKSYSEAVCESVGSVMNLAAGTGRILQPQNFAKEIYLRFNLPPLHTLKEKFIPEIVASEVDVKQRQFHRKADGIARQMRKLKYEDVSASLGNFRRRDEDKFNGIFM